MLPSPPSTSGSLPDNNADFPHSPEKPMPELSSLEDVITTLKASLDPLGATLDLLAVRIQRNPSFGFDDQLESIQEDMNSRDAAQQRAVDEVKEQLRILLDKEVDALLRKTVTEDVVRTIDERVEKEVAACLANHIPQHLQDEVATQQRELEVMQKELHNSESLMANANVRSCEPGKNVLHTLYMENGEISAIFPKTLDELLSFDLAKSKRLMEEYGIRPVSDARERNINRILQYVGSSYQVAS